MHSLAPFFSGMIHPEQRRFVLHANIYWWGLPDTQIPSSIEQCLNAVWTLGHSLHRREAAHRILTRSRAIPWMQRKCNTTEFLRIANKEAHVHQAAQTHNLSEKQCQCMVEDPNKKFQHRDLCGQMYRHESEDCKGSLGSTLNRCNYRCRHHVG